MRGARKNMAAERGSVLLTSERSVRGIDLPNLECVAMLYVPKESDMYVHMAGRTGRNASAGVALSVLRSDEVGRLGLFSGQLGLSIRDLNRELEREAEGDVRPLKNLIRPPVHGRRRSTGASPMASP